MGRKKLDGPRRQIRFSTDEDLWTVAEAVAVINENAETGAKASLNSFICDSALKEANRILSTVKPTL